MIRPFIKEMTRSELHAVCTGGFATIAGSVMAAYIGMGVSGNAVIIIVRRSCLGSSLIQR